MPKAERALVDWFSRHILKVGLALVLLASVVARLKLIPFYTNDMNSFLLPWVDVLREKGLAALAEGVGDYNIPYLLILSAIARLSGDVESTMRMIKLVSILFDYAMAAGVGLVVWQAGVGRPEGQRRHWAFLGFAITTILPMVMLNSGLWGQCDSIYACFGVWSVYFLMREKYLGAFILFGLGLCFKLQMIFLFPVFVILYFVRKRFTLFQFLIPPVLVLLSGLPAVLQGAPWYEAFTIYKEQTSNYEDIFIDYPGFSALIQDGRYEYFSTSLILLALMVCFAMLMLLLINKRDVRGADVLALATWSVMACVLFLPSMHERYGYMGEVLVVAWAIARPTKRTLIPAVVFTFTGYCCYANFLFAFLPVPFQYLALANLAAFMYMSFTILADLPGKRTRVKKQHRVNLKAQPVAAVPEAANDPLADLDIQVEAILPAEAVQGLAEPVQEPELFAQSEPGQEQELLVQAEPAQEQELFVQPEPAQEQELFTQAEPTLEQELFAPAEPVQPFGQPPPSEEMYELAGEAAATGSIQPTEVLQSIEALQYPAAPEAPVQENPQQED